MELKHAVIPFEVKQEDIDNDMGLFEGYGSVFGNVDLGGDIVMQGAFRESLVKWKEKQQLPQLLGFHQDGNVIGDWLEMREDEKGLYVKGQLWVKAEKRIEDAVRAHNIMKGTGPKGLSIGYYVKDQELVEFNGGTVRQIKEIELFEVSVVGYAMNPKADVTRVKNMTLEDGETPSIRVAEKGLRDLGFSKKQAQAILAGGYNTIKRDADGDDEVKSREDSSDDQGLLESLKQFQTTLRG